MTAKRAFLEHIGIADGSVPFAISSIYLMFRFALCGWRWSGSFGKWLYIRNFQE
jgi:hypothetical protein